MRSAEPAVLIQAGLAALPVLAHHAAEGIVDEEIYANIEAMVAETPHADLTITDLGGGMTETVLVTSGLNSFDRLMEDGMLGSVALLDCEVTVTIAFSGGREVVTTILQIEDPGPQQILPDGARTTPGGEVKSEYR